MRWRLSLSRGLLCLAHRAPAWAVVIIAGTIADLEIDPHGKLADEALLWARELRRR